MAKIPTGNFGNLVPQGTPGAKLNPNAYSSGDGLVRAGDTLMRVAGAELGDQRQEQAQIAAERDELINHVAAKEQRVQQELRTLKLVDKIKTRQDEIASVTDSLQGDVDTGRLSYNDVPKAFAKSLGKLGEPDLQGFDEVEVAKFKGGVNDSLRNAQIKLNSVMRRGEVDEHRSKVDSFLDGFRKDSGLPGADMNQLVKRLDAMDTVGNTAYGSSWEKKKQDTKDLMWFSNLNQQAMSVGSNVQGIRQLKKEITTGVYSDKLDSNNRFTLESRLEGMETQLIQRQEAAAQRAQREQERRLTNAEAAFNVFEATRIKGGYLSQEFTDRTINETKGTIYEAAVRDSIKQAKEIGGLASQPIASQKQLLANLDAKAAKEGRSPELSKQRDQVDKVFSASVADVKTNGIRAGLERNVIPSLESIDFTDPTTLYASLAKRIHAAQLVSAWAKDFVPAVSPFDNDEAEKAKTMFDALQSKEKSQFVGNIVSVTGPKFGGAIARQFGEKDRVLELAFAAGTSKTTAGRYVSERIFKGANDIKDRTVLKDDHALFGTNAIIAKQVDGLFPNEQMSDAVKDATLYIAASFAAEGNGNITPKHVRKALNLAIGGSVIEHNGKRLPIPAGFDEDSFAGRIKSITPDEVKKQTTDGQVRVGGVVMNVSDFTRALPGQELMPVGQGRYAVMVQGRPVTNTNGGMVIIKVQ